MTTITLPRATVEQALEALYEETAWFGPTPKGAAAIDALRAALAQQAEPDAYGYASRVAVSIWQWNYKDTAPNWKPLDDLMGVLTQIDNMTSGLTRRAQQAEPVEPVAWNWMLDGQPYGQAYYGKPPDADLAERAATAGRTVRLLYTAPPQRRPLPLKTVEKLIYENTKISPNVADDRELLGYIVNAVRAVERAVWEKNHG